MTSKTTTTTTTTAVGTRKARRLIVRLARLNWEMMRARWDLEKLLRDSPDVMANVLSGDDDCGADLGRLQEIVTASVDADDAGWLCVQTLIGNLSC